MDYTNDEADTGPETPRTCGACGGRSCRWCTRGYQDLRQQRAWSDFRERVRRISSTYSLLEKVVPDLIDGLESLGEKGMAEQGRECMREWSSAFPDSPEKMEASIRLSLFQSKAVILIMRGRKK